MNHGLDQLCLLFVVGLIVFLVYYRSPFRPNLSADIWVKTFNGGAYTDFAVTTLPRVPVEPERRNGKFVYRSDMLAAMRVGNGGPEFRFETLNGNVRIVNRGQ